MKIVFVARSLFPEVTGGAARVCYNLIKYLSTKDDLQIDVVHSGKTNCVSHFPNVTEYPFGVGRDNFVYLKKVNSFLRKRKGYYDAGINEGYSMLLYLRKREFPVLYHHHSFRWFQYWDYPNYIRLAPKEGISMLIGNIVKKRFVKYIAKQSDMVVSQGQKITELLQRKVKVPSDKILFAPSPPHIQVAATQEPQKEKIKNSFLSVGNLFFYKGWTYLIAAFNAIKNAKLYIIGGGPWEEKLRSMRKNENIIFLGRIDDEGELKGWYSRCECFILPSLSEGSPSVLPEALSFGLPIISTDVGGTGQFLNAKNSLKIKPGNVIDIIDAVNRFVSLSPQKKMEMGLESRRIFQRLPTWEENADIFYEALLKMKADFS